MPEIPTIERLLSEAVSHLAEGVLITNDHMEWPEPHIVFVNEAMCRMTGYSADELVGQSPRILQGDETNRAALDRIRAELSAGRSCTAEVINYRRDGTPYDVELFIKPFVDGHGQRTNFVSIHRDIAQRKQLKTATRESQERLRAVVDTAAEAIITIDRRGVIETFNRAAERMFGYSRDEVIGRNVSMLMPQPFRDDHDDYISRYLRTGEAKIIGIGREVTATRKDGSVFPIELAVGEIDHLQMFTGIVRDISERKEREERLRQADRLSSIGTLAAGLGHDMSSMLLPVRARLDLIDRAELPPQVREQVIEIRKSARYLQDLADGLHLLALDPEDQKATTEATDLDEWWTQTHTLLAGALPKHARFSASLPTDLPPIRVAPHRLTQAILNLLVNSGQAIGKEGRVRLWAEVDLDDEIVRLSVNDNGCGMTEEVKRRALEPFFTTKKRGLGTGLGLSLVHGVVVAASGAVEIDSAPGRGTTITITFPAATASHQVHLQPGDGEHAIHAVVSVRDKRIESLVVNLLEMAGVEVDATSSTTGPDDGLWVTDSDHAASDDIRQCVCRNCQVILLGTAEASWRDPQVHVLDNPNDFDALRFAISHVVEGASP